jgi:hypothetical protein
MKTYSYTFFNEIIRDRVILYIPIISCINRDTQEYNLAADGNVNRFITTFCKCSSYWSMYLVLPKKIIKDSDKMIKEFGKYQNLHLIYSDNFGIHAGEQRNKDEVVNALYEEIKDIDFDICIFESQKLGLKIMNDNPDKMNIWWNPVSKTNEKTRIFLEGYDEINSQIISMVDYMIVASPDQLKYYEKYNKKVIYLDKLIDRHYAFFDYKIDLDTLYQIDKKSWKKTIFYLPFRLTDEGYQFDKVMEYISKCKNDYIILYTDPNNSHVIDNLENKDKFYKVSSNRNTYYTILDHVECIIPYFEDLEFINHAAIHEFMDERCSCKVIVYKQNNNPYNIFSCSRIENYEG